MHTIITFPCNSHPIHRLHHYSSWQTYTLFEDRRSVLELGDNGYLHRFLNPNFWESSWWSKSDSFSLSALFTTDPRAIVLLLSGTFWRRHPDASSVLSFSDFTTHCHLFVTLCIYPLHHPQPRSIPLSITLAHFDHLNDGQSFSQSPSSNCVHYKVYFILHFIIYFLLLLFLPKCRWSWLNLPPPVSAYFFGSFSLSEHIVTLFVRAFHQHLFIAFTFFFFLARICYWYSRVT